MMVSIIIPTYNAEKYIAETIKSVEAQSYSEWEIIIVDDGSTDKSADIIKELQCGNDKITYFYQNNAGVSVARNNGIARSNGKYIALLDADDVWEKENLELKVEILETHNNVEWVYSDMYKADKNAEIIEQSPPGTDSNILDSILLWEREVVPAPCSNVVFLKKCFTEGVSFDKHLSTAADQDFTIQLACKYNGHYINKPLWRYRTLENSMSKNIAVMEKDHIAVFKKAAKNGRFKNFIFKQQCFSNLYWILAGSWWKDGGDKLKGIYFITLALLANPFSVFRIFKAFLK